jgi:hypothetical protein
MSHLLGRSRRSYEALVAEVRKRTRDMKKLNTATEHVQRENKQGAVIQELTAIEERVRQELEMEHRREFQRIAESVIDSMKTHEKNVKYGGMSMVVINADGTVKGYYAFRPVGPKVLTPKEFTELISALKKRAATEEVSLELSAAEIVRRFFVEIATS